MQRTCDHSGCCEEEEVKEEAVLGWKSLYRNSWVENFLVGSTTAAGKTAERKQQKILEEALRKSLGRATRHYYLKQGDLVEREKASWKLLEKSTSKEIVVGDAGKLPAEQTTASATTTITTFDCVSSSSTSEPPPKPPSL